MANDEQWEAMVRGWRAKNEWRWDGTIEQREREAQVAKEAELSGTKKQEEPQ